MAVFTPIVGKTWSLIQTGSASTERSPCCRVVSATEQIDEPSPGPCMSSSLRLMAHCPLSSGSVTRGSRWWRCGVTGDGGDWWLVMGVTGDWGGCSWLAIIGDLGPVIGTTDNDQSAICRCHRSNHTVPYQALKGTSWVILLTYIALYSCTYNGSNAEQNAWVKRIKKHSINKLIIFMLWCRWRQH